MKYSIKCEDCEKEYSDSAQVYNCPNDGGKLIVNLVYDTINVNFQELFHRSSRRTPLQERFKEFLPVNNPISLGEGYTPYYRAERLGDVLGLKNLWIKNETLNPTGSYKDRPILVGLGKAIEFGAETVATASSGNAANALAAGAAKYGIRCVAFVPENIPRSKAQLLQTYGAEVYRVKAENPKEDPTIVLLKKACKEFGWHPVAPFGIFNPYQIEGSKTMAYEIAEFCFLNKINAPDHVVVPVGSGGGLIGWYKGFLEFNTLGFVGKVPKIHAVQSEGCAPFVKVFNEKKDLEAWEAPHTVAGGLADNYTWDWKGGLDSLLNSHGIALTVSDREILEAKRLLSRMEGIFSEPTGAASLAGIIKFSIENKTRKIMKADDAICCVVTGAGWKDFDDSEKEYKEPRLIRPYLEELVTI
ncbi:threonine synthase [Candidatus Woesearchaeota archaeon]|nr:threonine synthase [Candidatus Woesearchaeota archaeon]